MSVDGKEKKPISWRSFNTYQLCSQQLTHVYDVFLWDSKGSPQKIRLLPFTFFWQCDEQKRKYRLAKWNILCQPKDQGGLGIQNLELKNIALLSKWLYRLLTTDGTWQQIIHNKYLGTKPLVQVQWKSGDSHFWASLMKVKRDFLRFGNFVIKDGSQVRFWEDIWLGNSPLREQYPELYNIVIKNQDTVAEVLRTPSANLSWRRDLIGSKLVMWNNLVSRLANVVLTYHCDEFKWNLNQHGVFRLNHIIWV